MAADKVWTAERIRRALLMRRYAWGKLVTQIADEAQLPQQRISDVIAGRPVSAAVSAALVGYLTTPAGPGALRQNYNRSRADSSKRQELLKKLRMLYAIGKRYNYAPRQWQTATRTNSELVCYTWFIEDQLKRRILNCYPEAKKRRRKMRDSAPVWKWTEYLETNGGVRVDPPRSGPPKGYSRPTVPSSLVPAGLLRRTARVALR